MKHNRNLLVVISMILLPTLTVAQEKLQLISPAGGNLENTSVQIEWSLGEVVTSRLEGAILLTQGFHQPKYTITSTSKGETLEGLRIAPNPTLDYLTISYRSIENLEVTLSTSSGAILKKEKGLESIDMTNYSPGVYFLLVQSETKISTFKIIKK